ncbi:MAG: hypothetical protein GEV03_10090 [Streptosporangiales bacterium]|nr:hypothetical protein [Streptosporangiales bacterium]
MRKYLVVAIAACFALAVPGMASADETDQSPTPPTPSASPTSSTETPTPDPSDPSASPSGDPSPGDSTTYPTATPSPTDDGADGSAAAREPGFWVGDSVVVPGQLLYVQGDGCKVGSKATVYGDDVKLGSFGVGGRFRVFVGNVTVPKGWAAGEHTISATCPGWPKRLSETVIVDPKASAPFIEVSDTTVKPGQEVDVRGGTCLPRGTEVTALDHSTGREFGLWLTNEKGIFSTTITIPERWSPGSTHPVSFACHIEGEGPLVLGGFVDFKVIGEPGGGQDPGDDGDDGKGEGDVQGGQLPFTGAAALPLLLGVGAALVAAGALLLMVRRRRT